MSQIADYISGKDIADVHLILYTKGVIDYRISSNICLHEPSFYFNKKLKIIYTFKTLFFLRKTVKKIKPWSVLSFGETYNSFVLLATLFLKTKVIVSDRSKPDKAWGFVHEFLRKLLYKRAYGIIAQTNYAREYIFGVTNHPNIRVIPNPINFSNLSHAPNNERKNVILNVGRLIKSKQIDFLIDVFSRLNNDEWELWIVGEGPMRSCLEARVKNGSFQSRVRFWGNQKDVKFFYSKASIFAFTSVSEGFPNALLEAAANGLPLISFDCIAGPAEIIDDGVNGFLIQETDLDTYLSKLQLMVNDRKLMNAMGVKSRKIAKNYDISWVGEQYCNFLMP